MSWECRHGFVRGRCLAAGCDFAIKPEPKPQPRRPDNRNLQVLVSLDGAIVGLTTGQLAEIHGRPVSSVLNLLEARELVVYRKRRWVITPAGVEVAKRAKQSPHMPADWGPDGDE